MSEIVIRLTWAQVWEAAHDGTQRYLDDRGRGWQERYGAPQGGPDGLVWNIMGAIGERAVCQWRRAAWRPFEFGIIDAGDCEVRATRSFRGRLILHREDRDHCPFILARVVPGELPDVTLAGWIMGWDGKREEWWGEGNPAKPLGRPAFWVARLHGMEELSMRGEHGKARQEAAAMADYP